MRRKSRSSQRPRFAGLLICAMAAAAFCGVLLLSPRGLLGRVLCGVLVALSVPLYLFEAMRGRAGEAAVGA